jgi:hypothetical protein
MRGLFSVLGPAFFTDRLEVQEVLVPHELQLLLGHHLLLQQLHLEALLLGQRGARLRKAIYLLLVFILFAHFLSKSQVIVLLLGRVSTDLAHVLVNCLRPLFLLHLPLHNLLL